jgi:hypothetical protein
VAKETLAIILRDEEIKGLQTAFVALKLDVQRGISSYQLDVGWRAGLYSNAVMVVLNCKYNISITSISFSISHLISLSHQHSKIVNLHPI